MVKSTKTAMAAIRVIPFSSFSLDLVGSPADRKSISFAAPPFLNVILSDYCSDISKLYCMHLTVVP